VIHQVFAAFFFHQEQEQWQSWYARTQYFTCLNHEQPSISHKPQHNSSISIGSADHHQQLEQESEQLCRTERQEVSVAVRDCAQLIMVRPAALAVGP
jgi:hypothetical protein